MERQDVITQQRQAIIDGESQVIESALGIAFDAGKENGGGGFTQADIDAAKASQLQTDQATIDALTNQVQALQADDDQKTKLVEAIKALLAPAQA